jgi:hypothetical protein
MCRACKAIEHANIAHKILMCETKGNRLPGMSRHGAEDNIKVYLKGRGWVNLDLFVL